ncbi:MAG: transcriptional repressor LexA [Acutalibacteraceae bacterium]|nr:transcriptional repressor LexA [Acutalibacteraceae bacterium]
MENLTKSQQKVFDYICNNLQEGGSPSVREICAATGLKSTATVHAHLKSLENKGLITRNQGTTRSIRLTTDNTSVIPIMGKVTAGMPILAVEDIQGYVPVSDSIRRGRELFALRVSGESMINAGILDNDIVIVHKTPVANNGQIVVAMVEDEATVKRFYKEDGHYRLQPENDDYEPIVVDECSILGQVISVVRYY